MHQYYVLKFHHKIFIRSINDENKQKYLLSARGNECNNLWICELSKECTLDRQQAKADIEHLNFPPFHRLNKFDDGVCYESDTKKIVLLKVLNAIIQQLLMKFSFETRFECFLQFAASVWSLLVFAIVNSFPFTSYQAKTCSLKRFITCSFISSVLYPI